MLEEAPYTVRHAAEADIPDLLRMGANFHAVTGVADIVALDLASLERSFRLLMANGAILVAEKGGEIIGATGALLHPHYMNADHLTGQELFWWIEPEHRGAGRHLLAALEDWVAAKNADSFTMIALDALAPEKVGKIYQRRGYRPVEHSYMRTF